MTPIEQARAIARAICVEYRLSPERYEASGGEHPIIHVIVKHVAPALVAVEAERDAALLASRHEADLCGQALADVARVEELEGALALAMATLQQIDRQATEALTKLDQKEDGQ